MNAAILIVAALALTAGAVSAAAAERNVVVNGMRLDPAQIGQLEAFACGPVPDGSYWLDMDTGVWGYADDPTPQGQLSGNCERRRPSLSERGTLFHGDDWILEDDAQTDWSGFRAPE